MEGDRQHYEAVVDRTGWEPGPWDDEPTDKAVWTDEATGYPCMINRHPQDGHWCGYVGVPEGHPLHGKSDIWEAGVDAPVDVNYAAPCMEDGAEENSICHIPLPGESDNVWWLGFDCGHYMDVQPGREAFRKKLGFPALGMTFPDVMQPTYKTEGYVRSLTAELAASLKKVHS